MTAKSAGRRMTSSIETEPLASRLRRRDRLLDLAGLRLDIGRDGRDDDADEGDHRDGPEEVLDGDRAPLAGGRRAEVVVRGDHCQWKQDQDFQHWVPPLGLSFRVTRS